MPKGAAVPAEIEAGETMTIDAAQFKREIKQELKQELKQEGYIALQTVGQLIIWHPVQHIAAPGVKNKVEGVFGLGGRALAGYGVYKLVRFIISKIAG